MVGQIKPFRLETRKLSELSDISLKHTPGNEINFKHFISRKSTKNPKPEEKRRRIETDNKIKHTKKRKKLKSFLGAIQYLSKYIKNLSAQTDILRKLLKNKTNGCGQKNTQKNSDASTKGLGATLWQKQKDGNLKPVGFASRFLSDTEKKYAINELELLAFSLICLWKAN